MGLSLLVPVNGQAPVRCEMVAKGLEEISSTGIQQMTNEQKQAQFIVQHTGLFCKLSVIQLWFGSVLEMLLLYSLLIKCTFYMALLLVCPILAHKPLLPLKKTASSVVISFFLVLCIGTPMTSVPDLVPAIQHLAQFVVCYCFPIAMELVK